MIRLRSAQESDLDYILAQESRPEFASFIFRWGRARHLKALEDPDKRTLIAERAGAVIGYVMLAGLRSEHRAVELVRILVEDPGRGLGREVLRAAMKFAFDKAGAHRLWLDVFTDNERAQRAYLAVGFRQEGILRDSVRQGGRYRSLVIMSLLEPEFRAGA